MSKKNKTLRNILVILIPLLLTGVLCLVTYLSRRIPMNPPGTIGNTAGNINNGGLFCQQENTVYFSNPYDGGSLYAMNADETNLRRINTLKVSNILAGGNYLYFFQKGAAASNSDSGFGQLPGIISFMRCKQDGSRSESLTRDTVISGQLVDNFLYLMTIADSGHAFTKIKIDGSEKELLAEYQINPACVKDGLIYYNGTRNDHYLYTLNTANDASSVLWQGNLWYPVVDGDYVYYMDVANNYRLCRYSLSQDVIQVLTQDRVDCFNLGGGYIYYQKNGSAPQLICMRMDGTDPRVIAEGNFTNINMTSQYVYFQLFGEDDTMYHSYIGSSTFDAFSAAAAAVPSP